MVIAFTQSYEAAGDAPQSDAQPPTKGARGPVTEWTVTAQGKGGGAQWYARIPDGHAAPEVGPLVVKKNNGDTPTVNVTGPETTLRGYRVVPIAWAKRGADATTPTAKGAESAAKRPAAQSKPDVPAFSDNAAAVTTADTTGAPIGHAIVALVVNGNTMFTVTVGTTVRLFATLTDAAAYAATA